MVVVAVVVIDLSMSLLRLRVQLMSTAVVASFGTCEKINGSCCWNIHKSGRSLTGRQDLVGFDSDRRLDFGRNSDRLLNY